MPFFRVHLKRTFLLFTCSFFICACIVYQIPHLLPPLSSSVSQPINQLSKPPVSTNFGSQGSSASKVPYLINTEACQVKDWPLFDSEILPLFESLENFNCDKNAPLLTIQRLNFTWLFIDFPQNGHWSCSATELARNSSDDELQFGPTLSNLKAYTNFDQAEINYKLKKSKTFTSPPKWDSVRVDCKLSSDSLNETLEEYSRVVPLIQHYQQKSSKNKPKFNIILLGIDSISRLNFLRQMKHTKAFLDAKGFIPLYGYHKVGENSFPNIFP